MKLSAVLSKHDGYGYLHWCPGCKETHTVPERDGGPRWSYDGNAEAPTFSPSVLIRWGDKPNSRRCHYFIRSGKIEFCSDSTHALAGCTVPMEPIPEGEDW